jgi:hypothetical protein
VGLVQKLLSKKYNKDYSFPGAIEWLSAFFKIDTSGISIEPPHEMDSMLHDIKAKCRIKASATPNLKKSDEFPIPINVIKGKIPPSEYFLKQCFTKETQEKFYIGHCNDPRKPMYMRSYGLVLNRKGDSVIGVTGRTVFEKCDICHEFHEQGKGCPIDNNYVRAQAKWLHYGFNTNSVIYNEWNVEPFVKKSHVAVITEGPKDVWWLDQHKIYNSMCVFGLKILNYHLRRLLEMGTIKLVVGMDNDEKGLEAIEKIKENYDRYFNIVDISHFMEAGQDIADISTTKMQEEVVPFLQKL